MKLVPLLVLLSLLIISTSAGNLHTTRDTTTFVEILSPVAGSFITGRNCGDYYTHGTGEVGGSVTVAYTDNIGNSISFVSWIGEDGTWGHWPNIGGLEDGVITLTASITDEFGNTASCEPVLLLKDATPPTGSVALPDNGASVGSVVTISGTTEEGVAVSIVLSDLNDSTDDITITTTADAQGEWSVEANIESLDDGEVSVVLVFTDSFGNEGLGEPAGFYKDSVTFVSFSFPSDLAYINKFNTQSSVAGVGEVGGLVELVVEDSSSRTSNIQATAYVSEEGTWQFDIDFASQAEGSLQVRVTITDDAGNTQGAAITLQKDTQVAVVITSPANLQFVVIPARATSVPVAGYGDVGSSVVVEISDADGQTVVSPSVVVSRAGTWIVFVNVSALSDGDLTIGASISDAAGNTASSNQLNLHKQ